jgi:hypothetical protein
MAVRKGKVCLSIALAQPAQPLFQASLESAGTFAERVPTYG